MRQVTKETKKDRVKIDLLRYLCLKQPELLIVELSELVEAPIEKTFIWIKVYDLPYHWKYKHWEEWEADVERRKNHVYSSEQWIDV